MGLPDKHIRPVGKEILQYVVDRNLFLGGLLFDAVGEGDSGDYVGE
jgi:hypothetical protein